MVHVLLPTDLGEDALNAAVLAVKLFGANGNRYTLLHVFGAASLADPLLPDMVPELQRANDDAVKAFEQRLRAACDMSGAEVRSMSMFGPLSAVVKEATRQHGIGLVWMFSAGRKGATILGSNTTDVIRTARVPVLEIPAGTSALSFDRILYADDRASITDGALDMLASIAQASGAEVIIAHVATGKPAREQVDHTATYQRLFKGLRLRTVMVENDDVESALLELADRERVDLIALLHRHTGVWTGLFHTSTTKGVALHSTIPVLALEQ